MAAIVNNAPLFCCKLNDGPFEGAILAFAWPDYSQLLLFCVTLYQ